MNVEFELGFYQTPQDVVPNIPSIEGGIRIKVGENDLMKYQNEMDIESVFYNYHGEKMGTYRQSRFCGLNLDTNILNILKCCIELKSSEEQEFEQFTAHLVTKEEVLVMSRLYENLIRLSLQPAKLEDPSNTPILESQIGYAVKEEQLLKEAQKISEQFLKYAETAGCRDQIPELEDALAKLGS